MVRRRGAAGRSLGAIDANLAGLKEQLLALQARIDAADEDRLDIIAKATVAAFPEIDANEYGDDLEKFLKDIRNDALQYRELSKTQTKESPRKEVITSSILSEDIEDSEDFDEE